MIRLLPSMKTSVWTSDGEALDVINRQNLDGHNSAQVQANNFTRELLVKLLNCYKTVLSSKLQIQRQFLLYCTLKLLSRFNFTFYNYRSSNLTAIAVENCIIS